VSAARRTALLILFGVLALVLAIIVLVRNKSIDSELLASLGLVGGLAIVVVSLPVSNGGKHE